MPERILDEVEALTRGRVLLTLDADGCCFREGGALRRVPAVPVEAVDATGAGDSFVAGVIAGLVVGQASPRRLRRAGLPRGRLRRHRAPVPYPRIPPLADLQ